MKRFAAPLLSLGIAASSLCACATSGPAKKELSRTGRAQMLVEVANGSLSEGDPTGALETLLRAEKEDSRLPELHHSKALAFFAKRDISSATAEARKAVELKPDYSDANNTLGKLLLDQGKYDEAIPYLTRAASDPLYRESFKPLTNLGIIHYRRSQAERAESFFSRAIESAPAGACVAYYYRGHVRMLGSRLREALADYESAGNKLCANFADAHLAMGIAYEQGKQYDLARKKYLEIQTRYPNTKVAEQAIHHLRDLP